jgi:hypothetical protein
MLGPIEIKMVALPKKADPAFGSENPADYTQFEELWDIMEDAVANIEYDVVPTDWRTIPELDDDPDDELFGEDVSN